MLQRNKISTFWYFFSKIFPARCRKRSRYYQSIIDMSNLNAGTEYDELKDTYIIFICLNDIFHKGLPVYSFENVCCEDKDIKLNDRAFNQTLF